MKASIQNSWSSLPGPDDITKVELDNGIKILVRKNFNSPSIVITGTLNSGSHFNPPDKLGLAYFTALSLMKGTQNKSFQDIYNSIESVGASLGLSVGGHYTVFSGRALSEDLPMLLEILSESLKCPVFPEEHIQKLRAQILTSIAIRDQDTGDRASMRFDKLVFQDHPYGNPDDGSSESISSINREDILNFHQKYYGPGGMIVVIVGAVEPEQAIALVKSALGDWKNAGLGDLPQFPSPGPLKQTIREHITIPGKSQVDLVMGTHGPDRKSPDFHSAALGNSILGQFGMMGRIGESVREKAGLAYHASSSLNSLLGTGSWEISAGVNPANVDRAIALIIAELQRFIRAPVSSEELEDSQANFIGRLPLSLESNAGVAGALMNMERFELGLDYFRNYANIINSITANDILQIAGKYINPDNLVIISAGPAPGE